MAQQGTTPIGSRPVGLGLAAPTGVPFTGLSSAGAKVGLSTSAASQMQKLNVNVKGIAAPVVGFGFQAPAPINTKHLLTTSAARISQPAPVLGALPTSFRLDPPKLRTSVPTGGSLLTRPLVGSAVVETAPEEEGVAVAGAEEVAEQAPVEAAAVEEEAGVEAAAVEGEAVVEPPVAVEEQEQAQAQ